MSNRRRVAARRPLSAPSRAFAKYFHRIQQGEQSGLQRNCPLIYRGYRSTSSRSNRKPAVELSRTERNWLSSVGTRGSSVGCPNRNVSMPKRLPPQFGDERCSTAVGHRCRMQHNRRGRLLPPSGICSFWELDAASCLMTWWSKPARTRFRPQHRCLMMARPPARAIRAFRIVERPAIAKASPSA